MLWRGPGSNLTFNKNILNTNLKLIISSLPGINLHISLKRLNKMKHTVPKKKIYIFFYLILVTDVYTIYVY